MNGSCLACPLYCSECISASSCSACGGLNNSIETWYYNYIAGYLNESELCELGGIQGCDQYTPNGTCISCVTGYALANSSCFACPKYCDDCDASGTCKSCIIFYYLNQSLNTCSRCSSINCVNCSNSTNCFACQDGLTLDQNGQCAACIYPCFQCDISDNGTNNCQQCWDGYGWNSTTNQCDPCPDGCVQCLGGIFNVPTNSCSAGINNTYSANQSSSNSSNGIQNSTNSNSTGSNQSSSSTNSSTTNYSFSEVTITIINAAGSVISENHLSIQAATFTVLVFDGTSTQSTNESSPSVGVIVLNGTDSVIPCQSQNLSTTSTCTSTKTVTTTSTATSTSTSTSSAQNDGSGGSSSANYGDSFITLTQGSDNSKIAVSLAIIFGVLHLVWMICIIILFIKTKKISKLSSTLPGKGEDAMNPGSNKFSGGDELHNKHEYQQQIIIQRDFNHEDPNKVDYEGNLFGIKHQAQTNQPLRNHNNEKKVPTQNDLSKGRNQNKLSLNQQKGQRIGAGDFSPQKTKTDSQNQLLLQDRSICSDDNAFTPQNHKSSSGNDISLTAHTQILNKKEKSQSPGELNTKIKDLPLFNTDVVNGDQGTNRGKIISKHESQEESNRGKQTSQKVRGSAHKFSPDPRNRLDNNEEFNENQSRDEEKKKSYQKDDISDEERGNGNYFKGSAGPTDGKKGKLPSLTQNDTKNTQSVIERNPKQGFIPRNHKDLGQLKEELNNDGDRIKTNEKKNLSKLPDDIEDDEAPGNSLKPEGKSTKANRGNKIKEDYRDDNSDPDRDPQQRPQRQKYIQKISKKNRQEQSKLNNTEEDSEVQTKNGKPSRKLPKEKTLNQIHSDPKVVEDSDEGSEDYDGPEEQSPPRKEYQQTVLKKLPFHPDVQEVNLEEDQYQNEEKEEEPSNNKWFFQKVVVDDDAM